MSGSIHPRVVDGATRHDKVNTCGPSRRTTRRMRRTLKRFDQRLAAHAATVRWCELNHTDPLAFRRPGSRNPAKLRNR